MEAYESPAFVTGEICRLIGLYRVRCRPAVPLKLDEGAVFPPCGNTSAHREESV